MINKVKKTSICVLLIVFIFINGCSSTIGVKPVNMRQRFKEIDRSALNSSVPSERTLLYLRRYDILNEWRQMPDRVIANLDGKTVQSPDRDTLFVLTELSFIQARGTDLKSAKAAKYYLACAFYAYNYMFDSALGPSLSPYDPHSKLACDFYNRSIAAMVLHFRSQKKRVEQGDQLALVNGSAILERRHWDLDWKPEEFNTYHVTYEYDVKGLSNHFIQFGIGVPLVLVKSVASKPNRSLKELFVPRFRQTYAATLIVHFAPFISQSGGSPRYRLEINIHDSINTSRIRINDQNVPLHSDYTTPLAYMIQENPIQTGISGLLDVESWKEVTGLHMSQPFQPDKIPIVFVHGLMSSPPTWLPMLNNLMGDPELRKHYQFWFFMYPTGNPILYSANTLRESLLGIQRTYDPNHDHPTFNRMVLIGHSMGGLLSKIMVQQGGDHLWHSIADIPIAELNLPVDKKTILERLFYFEPLPFIERVIFIAVPHRGSKFADMRIGQIGAALIKLPVKMLDISAKIFSAVALKPIQTLAGESDKAPGVKIDRIPTSIDSLSPGNPVLAAMAESPFASRVTFHSIIGNHKKADTPGGTDRVVPYESSHLEGAASEKIVHSDHSAHNHPLAIMEVRRILLDHLK